ncbi:hypothetical protein N9262_00860 [Akkermansiaceae bacterium]|nr:hypothetical protein [Akkermansiaceae bacterium]
MIKDKRILYIGPKFFGYEVEIQKTLRALGGKVDFFDDRPKNTFCVRVLIRLKLKIVVAPIINKYYKNVYKRVSKKKYDYVFVISPETLDYKKTLKLKKIQPDSKFILYMWDSFSNKNSFNTVRLFDQIISFDSKDAKKYDLKFLPLFYIKDYGGVRKKVGKHQYDLCIIATAHSDRYSVAKKLRTQMRAQGLTMFTYFYLPSKIMYWVRKLFFQRYSYGGIEDFSFTSLSQKKIVKIIEQSKVILDINHPLQDGLTSRCIESLGAGRKLITTNPDIKNYNFYNENNIRIIDRKDPIIDAAFFEIPYIKPENEIHREYSIEKWLIKIFNEN